MILIVDDDQVSRRLFVLQCERLGYRAQATESGLEALTLLESGEIQLVLLDMRMEPMDGFDTARAIRRLGEPACQVPIVAVTADALRCSLEDCREAGIDALVFKPLQRGILESTLAQLLTPG